MSSIQKKQVKPLCKVCKDAGQCESDYSSHFVKSNPGVKAVIVCPTLLAYECTYCHKTGHSIGYCMVLKSKNKEMTRLAAQRNYDDAIKTTPAPNKNKKTRAKFMALVDSSDDEDDDEVVVIASSNKRKFAFSYAEAITKDPVPLVVLEQKVIAPVLAQKKRSWAYWSDSDDDDEEEEE